MTTSSRSLPRFPREFVEENMPVNHGKLPSFSVSFDHFHVWAFATFLTGLFPFRPVSGYREFVMIACGAAS